MKILIFTNLCIDKNVSENSSYESWGSPGMYLSRVFNKLKNTDVEVVSSYGEDYLKYLKQLNVFPPTPTSKTTLTYENITKNGRRNQKAKNRNLSEPIKLDEVLKKKIKKADVIILAPLLPNFSVDYVEKILKENSDALKVIIPQGYFRKFDEEDNVLFRKFEEEKILDLFDFMILSIDDYPKVENMASDWISWNKKLSVIATNGKNGAIVFDKKGRKEISTIPMLENEVVCSVGSGEVFSAAFIYNYFENKNKIEAIEFANKIARIYLKYLPEDFDKIEITTYL